MSPFLLEVGRGCPFLPGGCPSSGGNWSCLFGVGVGPSFVEAALLSSGVEVGPSFSGFGLALASRGWCLALPSRGWWVGPSFSGFGLALARLSLVVVGPSFLLSVFAKSILEWELALLGMEVDPLPSGGGNWVPSQPFLLVVGGWPFLLGVGL